MSSLEDRREWLPPRKQPSPIPPSYGSEMWFLIISSILTLVVAVLENIIRFGG